jgi:hypothetical protein
MQVVSKCALGEWAIMTLEHSRPVAIAQGFERLPLFALSDTGSLAPFASKPN